MSHTPNDWMWAQACELLDQAERMHRQFFRLASPTPARAVWEPPVDVFEDEREVVVIVALPGVSPERIEVQHRGEGHWWCARKWPLPFAGRDALCGGWRFPMGTSSAGFRCRATSSRRARASRPTGF